MGGWFTKVIAVPTKSGDEVVNSSRLVPDREHDAFAYYSNDQVRIQTLKLWGRSSNNNQEEPQSQQQHQERKTRISFELHPSLILEDILNEAGEEGLFDGDDEAGIDDILDLLQNLRAHANSPHRGASSPRCVADERTCNM